MSIFNSAEVLSGESFSHGLSPYDPSITDPSEFSPSRALSVLVDESGRTNFSGPLLFHRKRDPVDSTEIPEFSKDNKFVKGLQQVMQSVPDGGIILYGLGDPFRRPTTAPPGFVLCDGKSYFRANGTSWAVPLLDPLETATYIQKLPADVTLDENLFALRSTRRRSG
jgi:hypothetical protein